MWGKGVSKPVTLSIGASRFRKHSFCRWQCNRQVGKRMIEIKVDGKYLNAGCNLSAETRCQWCLVGNEEPTSFLDRLPEHDKESERYSTFNQANFSLEQLSPYPKAKS